MINRIVREMKRVRTSHALPVLTLFFCSLLFFYDLFLGRFLLTERDLGPYFIPPRFFWVESIKQGHFPLWNPYQFSGHPFFANPQHGVFYPIHILFFILPFDIAFNSIIVLHFFLGGLFTYLFLRDLKAKSSGALLSGLTFMLSGYLLSVHSLLTILLSSVWTPFIMMFFRRAIQGKEFKNEILTAVMITISFLGGGIEIVYGNFIVLFMMVIFSPLNESVQKSLGGISLFGQRLKVLFMVILLFLFLSAIQLIPFLELYHHSIRGKGISYQEATTWSFAPKDLLLFFLPDAYGYFLDMKKYWVSQCWFKTLYTGGLPFILSSIFFVFGKERKLFLVLMIFSIFFALGHYNPLYPFVFQYLPFFNGIRYPAKFLYIFILTLSMTTGLGFQRLMELSPPREGKRLKNIFTLLSLFCGLSLLFLVIGHEKISYILKTNEFDFPRYNFLSVNLFNGKRFFFYLTLFFLFLRIGLEVKWKEWIKMGLIFFLITDLFGNMGFYGREKTSDYFQKTKIIERISSDQDHFRVFSTPKTISQDTTPLIHDPNTLNLLKEKHLPSMNLLYRLHDIWGIEVIRLKRLDDLYRLLISAPSISSTHLINLYGVRYVVSVTPLDEDKRFELIDARVEGLKGDQEDLLKENTIKLYRIRDPILRAWLVKDFKMMSPEAMLIRMASKEFHPDQEVLLEEEPRFNPFEKKGKRVEGEIKLIHESNNRIRLLVKASEDAMLVLNDTYFPGWKVYVDGKRRNIFRANYTFRAVALRGGTHQIEFIYEPMSFKLGMGGTILGILGCMAIAFLRRPRRFGFTE